MQAFILLVLAHLFSFSVSANEPITIETGSFSPWSQVVSSEEVNYIYAPFNSTGATPSVKSFASDWKDKGNTLKYFEKNGEFFPYRMVKAKKGIFLVGLKRKKDSLSDIAVLKLMSDGSSDPTFGKEGMATVTLTKPTFTHYLIDDFNAFEYTNGKLSVVIATEDKKGRSGGNVHLRLNQNGSLDQTFGKKGILFTTNPQGVEWGKRDVVKWLDDGSYFILNSVRYSTDARLEKDFLIRRITSAGLVDSTFGVNGDLEINYKSYACVADNILQTADQNFVILCRVHWDWSPFLLMTKFSPEGTLDQNFGHEGFKNTELKVTSQNMGSWFSGTTLASLMLPDDSLLVAHYFQPSKEQMAIKISKLNSKGELDLSFGTNGSRVLPMTYEAGNIIQIRNVSESSVELVSTSDQKVVIHKLEI